MRLVTHKKVISKVALISDYKEKIVRVPWWESWFVIQNATDFFDLLFTFFFSTFSSSASTFYDFPGSLVGGPAHLIPGWFRSRFIGRTALGQTVGARPNVERSEWPGANREDSPGLQLHQSKQDCSLILVNSLISCFNIWLGDPDIQQFLGGFCHN